MKCAPVTDVRRTSCLALAFLLLIVAATPSAADYFTIYADEARQICALTDNGAGSLVSVYVWHMGGKAVGTRFGISPPIGTTWAFVGFENPFGQIATSAADIALNYGVCIDGDTYLGVASWISTTPASPCSVIAVWPITVTDCALVEHDGIFSQPMIVNPDYACHCFDATAPATWGSVKALYR
jgi:hypothetical protein